ncbi:DUF1653 domain-containing protein [Achromobacter insolitus]|uniref:DUF1653 domain-containing protein n=1 Tax=Achromobacter insolitus TaxID=217204 RepID=UPI0007C2A1B3|nr:DUF1653 domain-containing protein [Achromobacter insolitus]OAD16491.1 hypothetical protein A3839_28490 [Achromobacter insolitus]
MSDIILYDMQTGHPAVVRHPGVSAADVKLFCEKNSLQFYAMGCPEGAGGAGWSDSTVFRTATHEYPARGATIALDTVAEWKRAFDAIGPRVVEGGVYRHWEGGIYTTMCEATEMEGGRTVIVYRDAVGRAETLPIEQFFGVEKGEGGRLVPRFAFVRQMKGGV